eukprot:SAG31_NODE_2388_length_5808_cov_2.772640_8_plen_175_part_00
MLPTISGQLEHASHGLTLYEARALHRRESTYVHEWSRITAWVGMGTSGRFSLCEPYHEYVQAHTAFWAAVNSANTSCLDALATLRCDGTQQQCAAKALRTVLDETFPPNIFGQTNANLLWPADVAQFLGLLKSPDKQLRMPPLCRAVLDNRIWVNAAPQLVLHVSGPPHHANGA